MAMRMGASGAMQTRADAKTLGGFGQMWEPGSQGTVFYPIFYNEETNSYDLLVGAIWGHSCSPELGLKAIFIPSLTDVDESGVPIGKPDVTYQFSRIAKSFIDGEKELKLQKIAEKPWPSKEAERQAIQGVEDEFDSQKNPKAKKPVIGKLSYLITTEVVYVPIENDIPQTDKARLVTQSLSDERIRKLLTILTSEKYKPAEGEEWLEVQFSFPAGSKMQAGRTDPVGQVAEWRMKNKYPEQFKAIESLLQQLPKSYETISRRNYSYRKISETAILNALTTYSVMNAEFLEQLNEDMTEQLVKNAEIMDRLSITNSIKNEELRKKIQDELAEIHKEPMNEPKSAEPSFSDAPTIDDMLQTMNKANEEMMFQIDSGVLQ